MQRFLALAALAAAVVVQGCSSVECGPDTVEENGKCLPQGLGRCAPGTTLSGDTCKPVCPAGTSAGTNGCVLSDAACGPGTELRNGQCRQLSLFEDVTDLESTEPNDSAATAKRFVLPAIGEEPRLLGGIVMPPTGETADFDAFVFTATALQRIRIDAQAVGAPSVGVVVQKVGASVATWRYVVSLESRNAAREITLPSAGDYLVRVSEATNLDLVETMPRGSPEFTYAIAVSQLEAATVAEMSGSSYQGNFADAKVIHIPGNGTSTQLLELTLEGATATAFPGARAVWAVDAEGQLVLEASDTVSSSGSVTRMTKPSLVLPPSGVRLGVDYLYATGATGGFKLSTAAIQTEEIVPPFPYRAAGELERTETAKHIYSVDVEPNTIVQVTVDGIGDDLTAAVELRNSKFEIVAGDTDYSEISLQTFVTAPKAGRWFIVIYDDFHYSSDTDLEYSLTVSGETATSLALSAVPGSGLGSVQVPSGGAAWVALSGPSSAVGTLTATPSGALSVTVAAYSGSISEISSKSGTGAATVELEKLWIPSVGVQLVKVTTASPGTVSLALEAVEPWFKVETEPNGGIASAEALELDTNGEAEIAGFLQAEDDDDYFKIEVPGTGTFDLEISTTYGVGGGKPDTYVVVYDSAGEEVDYDDDGSSSEYFSLLELPDLDAGTYYIRVYYAPFAGDHDDADYTLMVSAK